jgi:MucB/RseB C-terminal domain
VDARGYRWLRRSTALAANGKKDQAREQGGWQASALPPGFRLTARTTRQMPGADGPVAHLVFSDGLASVSVFVELKETQASTAPPDDSSQLGSSATYTTMVDGHRVTAIGEVPPATVRAIAQSLSADPEPSLRAIREAVSGESQRGFGGAATAGGMGAGAGGGNTGMGFGSRGASPADMGGAPPSGGGGRGRPH